MKRTLTVVLLSVSLVVGFTISAMASDKATDKEVAKKVFDEFKNQDPAFASYSIEAIHDFKKELRNNKEWRSLIKKARKDEVAAEAVSNIVQYYFLSRGIHLSPLRKGPASARNVLLIGGGHIADRNSYNDYLEFGVGLGMAKGWSLLACQRDVSGVNYGLGARAVVGAGIGVGIYVGENGLCVLLSALYGLNVSVGIGKLDIEKTGEQVRVDVKH